MVVIGKTRGLRSAFCSKEDERRDTPGRVEKGLEGVLFLSLHLEAIPLELSTYPAQSLRLSPLPTDAASVHKEKDH